MTDPRRIIAGTTYLLSRRNTQRQFLLKPTVLTNLIFKYVLAVAAARYGMLLHAVCVMSNHVHLVLTDPNSRLPEFCHFLDGVVAKAMNAMHRRTENFWAPASYSAVELISPADVVEKIAYTLANPALAGLIERGAEWPGVWSDPRWIGGAGEVVPRPGLYFSPNGTMPESEVLVFSIPPGFASAEDFRAQVIARVKELEQAAASDRAAKGVTVLGVRSVRKQRHTDQPTTAERRGGINPRIAAKDKWKRMEAIQRLTSFLERHREALERYCRGERETLFPAGTYLMRVRFGVACASS